MRPFAPNDVDEASAAWGANCGPAALAAALGVQVADVRRAVSEARGDEWHFKGYMGLGDMRRAIRRAGARTGREGASDEILSAEGPPKVVLVQWCGSWEAVPRAAATYRHWIASVVLDGVLVYDVNENDWLTLAEWIENAVPQLMPKRGTGWRVQWTAEVLR